MRKTEIRVESANTFFERGRVLSRRADQEGAIPSRRVVAFEDVESLLHLLTEKRVLLLKQLKETPASISDLARKLGRDRSRSRRRR